MRSADVFAWLDSKSDVRGGTHPPPINRGNYCIHRCILSCIDFCRPLSALSIDLGNGKPVTCGFGVAQLAAGESAERLVARADEAVYRAKLNGRNRVELANSVAARKGIGSAA